jgi:diketogulonate reductase-like aldo/keto reductase
MAQRVSHQFHPTLQNFTNTYTAYKTEPELGTAIKESGVPREKLFITTKVNDNINDIQGAIKASLRKLQLDYVDL